MSEAGSGSDVVSMKLRADKDGMWMGGAWTTFSPSGKIVW